VDKKAPGPALSAAPTLRCRRPLAQTRATLPPLHKALAVRRRSPAVSRTRDRARTFRLDALLLPADLPVSLASQLVEQRPDVRAAEEQLHTASANVGVARVGDRCSHPPMSRPPDGETNVTPKPIATRIQLARA
jgi:hypothetical protein